MTKRRFDHHEFNSSAVVAASSIVPLSNGSLLCLCISVMAGLVVTSYVTALASLFAVIDIYTRETLKMMSMLTVDSDTVTWWSWSIMIFAVTRIRLRGHKDNVLLHWRWRNRQWFGNREHQAILDSALETQNRPSLVWEGSSGCCYYYGQLSLWGVMCYSCVGPISPSPLSQVTSAQTEIEKVGYTARPQSCCL